MLGLLVGCRPVPPVEDPSPWPRVSSEELVPSEAEPKFSGEAALRRVEELMGWPRGLGDPRRGESIEALAGMLERAGASKVERQELSAPDPATGESFALVNLLAHVRPEAPHRFVLATHFDTRPWADEEEDPAAHAMPVPGANDGTSGVAVVLELMPLLIDALPEHVGLTVILFDGEELGRPGQGGYCMGSRHFAAQAAAAPPAWLAEARLGVVLDMVGDRDLHVPMEPGSAERAPALVDRLWEVAATRGHVQFENRLRSVGIIDDHVYLHEAGIPSILIIDKEYEPWHTRRDTLDRVSAQSLEAVGDTVLHAFIAWAAEASPG